MMMTMKKNKKWKKTEEQSNSNEILSSLQHCDFLKCKIIHWQKLQRKRLEFAEGLKIEWKVETEQKSLMLGKREKC